MFSMILRGFPLIFCLFCAVSDGKVLLASESLFRPANSLQSTRSLVEIHNFHTALCTWEKRKKEDKRNKREKIQVRKKRRKQGQAKKRKAEMQKKVEKEKRKRKKKKEKRKQQSKKE